MDLGLADRAFVVTAASGGLGRATASSSSPKAHAWCWSRGEPRFSPRR